MNAARLVRACLILIIALAELRPVGHGQAAPPPAPPGQTPPPILIADYEFRPEDWAVTAEAIGGSTYTITQQLSGGNAGPEFRFMSHRLPPVSGGGLNSIAVTHVYLGASYDPSIQGAISAIDYSEWGRIFSFPWPEAFSTTRPVVVQDGQVYSSPRFMRFIAQNGSHNWDYGSILQLAADDFFPPGGAENDNPDFSTSGGPIQFGFLRSNTRGSTLPPVPADQDLVIDQGVDNWQIWVHRAAPPPPVNHPPQAVDDVFILNGDDRGLPLVEILNVVSNDIDPDSDRLAIGEVTAPVHGTAGSYSDTYVVYQLDEAQASDYFDYTIADGQYTDTARVDVIIDCACTVLCLNHLELPAATVGQRVRDAIDLPLIYGVRDQVLKATPLGRRYVDMYYTRTPDLLVTILLSPTLRAEAVSTVELWQPNLRSLVEGDGSAVITQAQVDAIESFLDHLAAGSNDRLQRLIADERLRLGPLDDYVGLSWKAAPPRTIGDPVLYLPAVLR